MPVKILVFASGRGSNLKTIHEAILEKKINAVIKAVFSDRENAPVLDYARSYKIETVVFNQEKNSHFYKSDKELLLNIQSYETDFILLAGYMKFLPLSIVEAYRYKIVNIHPSLLPSFGGKGMYGMNVHQAVYSAGVKISGATVHFVNEYIDEGQILCQKPVLLTGQESPKEIAKKVLAVEHQLYPKALSILVSNKYEVCNNRVVLK